MNSDIISWAPRFELGIEDIDFQHHFFLNLINRLASEFESFEKNADYKAALISELNAYARFHFISEENMMVKYNYPGLKEHREHHRNLIDQLSAKEVLFLKKKSTSANEEIIHFLIDWFINHTSVEDRLFADYIKQSYKQ